MLFRLHVDSGERHIIILRGTALVAAQGAEHVIANILGRLADHLGEILLNAIQAKIFAERIAAVGHSISEQ